MAPQAPPPRSPRSKGLHGLLPWLVDAAQCVPVMLERKPDPHPLPGVPVKTNRCLALDGGR